VFALGAALDGREVDAGADVVPPAFEPLAAGAGCGEAALSVGLVPGVGTLRGVGAGVATGALVAVKVMSSATTAAALAEAGRSITRTRALRAVLGACEATRVAVPVTSRVVTRLESATASCEPLPSVDAYHATRSHAALASPLGRRLARAAYHAPGSTVTVSNAYFVLSVEDVSSAARPVPSRPGETVESVPPTLSQPSSGASASKLPFTSVGNTGAGVAIVVAVGTSDGVATEVGTAVGVLASWVGELVGVLVVGDVVDVGVAVGAGGGSSRVSEMSSM